MLYTHQTTHYVNAETHYNAIAVVMDTVYQMKINKDEFVNDAFCEFDNGMAVLAEKCSSCNLWRVQTLLRFNKKS
jgi:hypothetical protein